MRALRNVADTGRTIICTIHQPSYDVFTAFDDLVLLSPGGRQVYSGSIGYNAQRMVDFFMRCPTVRPLPPRVNPGTWMLHELEAESARVFMIATEAMGAIKTRSGAQISTAAQRGRGR